MNKDNSEYEIDRELTGKFAIEKNAEYQEKIEQLEEENKNLRDYADNLDSENDNQAIEIEELKKENKKLKEDVDYRHHRCMVAERQLRGEDEE